MVVIAIKALVAFGGGGGRVSKLNIDIESVYCTPYGVGFVLPSITSSKIEIAIF